MTTRTFSLSRQRRRRTGPAESASPSAGARPAAPRLPHEHDQYVDTPQPPRAPIVQAGNDLKDGQQDTDLHGKAAQIIDGAQRKC